VKTNSTVRVVLACLTFSLFFLQSSAQNEFQNQDVEIGDLQNGGYFPNGPILYTCDQDPYPIPNWHSSNVPNIIQDYSQSADWHWRFSNIGGNSAGFGSASPADCWQGDGGVVSQNDHYFRLNEGVGDPALGFVLVGDNIMQTLPNTLSAGDAYVLEYQAAFFNYLTGGSASLTADQFEIDVFLDVEGTSCNVANTDINSQFIPSAQGFSQSFSLNPSLAELGWQAIVHEFQIPSGLNTVDLVAFQSSIDISSPGSNGFDTKCQFIDDFCLTNTSWNPISMTSNLTGGTFCTGQLITVEYDIALNFSGSNSNDIDLQLDFPLGGPWQIVENTLPNGGYWFDASGSLTVGAGDLQNNGQSGDGLTAFVQFFMDDTAVLNQDYALTVDIDQNSPTGFICHQPIDL
jgi:hypothetical protein